MLDLLTVQRELNAAALPLPGEPGSAEALRGWAEQYADECEIDHRGNLVCVKRGTGGKKLMFTAPMETSGFWVTGVNDHGYLHLEGSPGIAPGLLPATPLRFAGGVRGTVRFLKSADQMENINAKVKMEALFCDIGAPDREEALKHVSVGDRGVFDGATYAAANGAVLTPDTGATGPAIALLLALEATVGNKNDVYFVFSSGKGHHTGDVEKKLAPDWVINVNQCPAGDSPSDKPGFSPLKLGGGPALLLNEGPGQGHPNAEIFRAAAGRAGLSLQEAVASRAWNLAGFVSGKGRGMGGLGVPVRHMHTPGEIYHTEDVRALSRLLAALADTEIGG